MTGPYGTHGPTHTPTALALLATLLEAGIAPPSHRQLSIAADALADHLAEVGLLVVVAAPPPGDHRGQREAVVDQPTEVDR